MTTARFKRVWLPTFKYTARKEMVTIMKYQKIIRKGLFFFVVLITCLAPPVLICM